MTDVLMPVGLFVVMSAGLFVILSNCYDDTKQKWAYGVVSNCLTAFLTAMAVRRR
jgi:hypothetical protein